MRSRKTDEVEPRTATADRVARSVCPYCAVGCGQKVFVKDEKVVQVEGDPMPEMSGHYHPKLRLAMKGRSVSRRCFVASATKLILPAYGTLTGGLDAHHPEILKKVGPGASALVPVTDRLLRFPIAA